MSKLDILADWIQDQIDMDVSCKEDLEMTECIKNDYYEGTISAYEKVLKIIAQLN